MDNIQTLITELTSGDDERAEAVAARFVTLGNDGLHGLRDLLAAAATQQPEDVDIRWWALRALSEFIDPLATALLIHSLQQDPDAGVRQCAALGLRKQANPETIPALIQALNDPDPLCMTLAADTLAVIGFSAASSFPHPDPPQHHHH